MEKSRMKKGMYVTISRRISTTDRTYGSNDSMHNMTGKTYEIEKVRNTDKGLAAIIKGCFWCPEDLTEQSVTKKPEPFHFNIKELSI